MATTAVAVQKKRVIRGFFEEYGFLSNFSGPVSVSLDGMAFKYVENAYQAAKVLDKQVRKKFLDIYPHEAKKIGNEIDRSGAAYPDWIKFRDSTMYNLVCQKFLQEPFRSKLLATEHAELVHDNNWDDSYWGVYRGIGKNKLGKILMLVRSQIKAAETFLLSC